MDKSATALTIAGSDSGGGAGIQADLKTFSALGVFGTSAVTAVTAQNTLGVTGIAPVPDDLITAQIKAVLDDIGADAVKIGMLGTANVVETVARALADYRGSVVLDPVMVAKSGDALLADAAIAALRVHLVTRAELLTPNLPEAARLLETEVAHSAEEVIAQGCALLAMGAKAVLMKGGHAHGPVCIDRLITATDVTELSAPRIDTRNTHGTGCTLSSAIAAHLAGGLPLTEATRRAHEWLHQAILAADRLAIGAGHGPVHHFHAVWI